jgi:hypothetical protein
MLSRDTGLYMSGEFAGDCLGIGTTWDSFHSSGTRPVLSDWLNREVTDGAMLVAVFFSINAEILSGPVESCEAKSLQ